MFTTEAPIGTSKSGENSVVPVSQKAVTTTDTEGTLITVEEEGLLFGLNKLLDALEAINGRTVLDKRGELRSQFYLELARRPGERI